MEAKTTSDETVCWPASLLTLSSIQLTDQVFFFVLFFSDRIPHRGRLAVGILQQRCITAQHEAIWFWGGNNTLRWMDGLCIIIAFPRVC